MNNKMQNDKSKPIKNTKEKEKQMLKKNKNAWRRKERKKKCKGATGSLYDGVSLTLENSHGPW